MYSVERALLTGLGPLTGALPTTATAPLTTSGVLNSNTLGAAAVKVLSASTSPTGRARRCRLICLTAARNISYATAVAGSSAPTLTAVGDGTGANDGVLLIGIGASRDFTVADNLDVYAAASGAATGYQFSVVEQ